MKFLMYGAGSIGRGFIGPLFSQAGYEVAFVDVNERIIAALNERHSYHYTVASQTPYDIAVNNVRGVDGKNEEALIEEIASCDLMATSLGAAILQRVAPILAKGFMERMRRGGKPLNILICENLKDSSHLLREWMSSAIDAGYRQDFAEKCGLIEAAIGRMVPVAGAGENADPLHITVEAYGFLPVDKAAFVGEPPEAAGLIAYAPFSFYEERKLYLHNMGHAICAYLGTRKGYATIAQAVADAEILQIVQSAMTESAAMLSQKYSVPFARIFDHAEDLLLRFSNVALGDTCERVGRDPMRKLADGDRLAGALKQCGQYAVHPAYIAAGFAAALHFVTDDEAQAEEIAVQTSKLSANQTALVMQMYRLFASPGTLAEISMQIQGIKRSLRGDIV